MVASFLCPRHPVKDEPTCSHLLRCEVWPSTLNRYTVLHCINYTSIKLVFSVSLTLFLRLCNMYILIFRRSSQYLILLLFQGYLMFFKHLRHLKVSFDASCGILLLIIYVSCYVVDTWKLFCFGLQFFSNFNGRETRIAQLSINNWE